MTGEDYGGSVSEIHMGKDRKVISIFELQSDRMQVAFQGDMLDTIGGFRKTGVNETT